tara:strand:+ start:129 stop:356 length:228 start_codon:yes stop_codon:yes gene_type:complete
MSPDELRAKLEEAGIPVGEPWKTTREKVVRSPLVERQKVTLRKIEGLIEHQLAEDQKRVADLNIALVRLKHGGGT